MRRDECVCVCVCVCACVCNEGKAGRERKEGERDGKVPVLKVFNPKINSIHAFFYWDKLRQWVFSLCPKGHAPDLWLFKDICYVAFFHISIQRMLARASGRILCLSCSWRALVMSAKPQRKEVSRTPGPEKASEWVKGVRLGSSFEGCQVVFSRASCHLLNPGGLGQKRRLCTSGELSLGREWL